MSIENPFTEPSEMIIKPSSRLNVLTILTIIGSAMSLLSSIWGYFSADKNYEQIEKTMKSADYDNAPNFVKGMINQNTLELARKSLENRIPLLIVGVIGSILCLYGAIAMRKLKKDGFLLWLIGELLPLIATLLFIGLGAFSGFSLLGLAFPVLFIALYATCRKEWS